MKYVVVRIGCLECNFHSTVLGIFDTKNEAEKLEDKINETEEYNSQFEIQVLEYNPKNN